MFLETIQHFSLHQPNKVAIEFVDEHFARASRVRYGELEQTVLRTMAMLGVRGGAPGDRVAIQLPKCLPFIYLHLAVMRLGAVSLPLNTGYPARELAYFLSDAGARLYFGDAAAQATVAPALEGLPRGAEAIFLDCASNADFDKLIDPLLPADATGIRPPAHPEATCLMIYTSGTTGQPKGAELTHGNLTANLASLHEAWGWQNDDVLLHVLPIFHVHGLVVALHGALNAGATTIMHRRFDPAQALATLAGRPCTVFMGVPTIHRRLVDAAAAHPVSLRHLRLITSGSDRLPDDLFTQFQAVFGCTLLERYGMSETSMLISNPLHGERRVGSVGLPLPGVAVRIVDPESGAVLGDDAIGEVQVRGANVFKGYWRQPEKSAAAFTADGWFRTGDLGLRSADGYYTLKGRSKDLIISGGFNVYPPEVELVLAEHPDVAASAVIGCPDPEWGERVVAVVVKAPGAAVSAEELVAFCRARLVHYKAPRAVIFVAELPRNAMGKVQKAELRGQFCG